MHYDGIFCPICLKTSIYLIIIRDYHHTKFGLVWIKDHKVTGGGGADSASPQVENVLSRPGEVGLKSEVPICLVKSMDIFTLKVDIKTSL